VLGMFVLGVLPGGLVKLTNTAVQVLR